jgi:hypothetical protein
MLLPIHNDGAKKLSELIPSMVSVSLECLRCERRGQFNLRKLFAENGDADLDALAAKIAKCSRAKAANFHNRCHIRWTGTS